jgi:hypothetical protein
MLQCWSPGSTTSADITNSIKQTARGEGFTARVLGIWIFTKYYQSTCVCHWYTVTRGTNKQQNSVAFSPQANCTGWATATCRGSLEYESSLNIINQLAYATDIPLHVEQTNNKTPWPLVRKRTIPTGRPPLVDEIYYQLLWTDGCCVVSAADPLRSLITIF